VTDPDCQDSRPGLLFSDRGWLVKLGLALAILSLLCARARWEVAAITPSVEDGVLDFGHARDKAMMAWTIRVQAVSPEGFDAVSTAGPLHISTHGLKPVPAPGQLVSVAGRFVEARRIEATLIRLEDGYALNRGLNYGLSSLTVLGFLFLARKRFRVRLREGLFRSRY